MHPCTGSRVTLGFLLPPPPSRKLSKISSKKGTKGLNIFCVVANEGPKTKTAPHLGLCARPFGGPHPSDWARWLGALNWGAVECRPAKGTRMARHYRRSSMGPHGTTIDEGC